MLSSLLHSSVPLAIVLSHVQVDLQAEDYAAAAALAFELKQPRRLLAVVNRAAEQGTDKSGAILNSLAAGFDDEQLKSSLEYAREWNTNSRHCHAAQALLQAILAQHSPQVRKDDQQ